MDKYAIHYSKTRDSKGLKPFAIMEQVEPDFSRGVSQHRTEKEAETALAKLKESGK